MKTVLSVSQLDQLADVLRGSAGLAFPEPRRAILQRAALEAMHEIGLTDPAELARLVSADRRRCARLAALATIGETYFFRHAEQLEEVRRAVIDPLVATRARDPRPRLRVWSAGCSGGEEAYTLAMLLAEAIPDIERWDVTVVGTDLDDDALARARTGAYGSWSLRGPLGRHGRWLTSSGTGVQVVPAIQRLVTFEHHNLATLPARPPALRDGGVDLISCRNVMIYLDRSVLDRVLDGLRGSLVEGGWLVVSPVEASMRGLSQRFELRSTPAGALYRRRSRRRAAATIRSVPTTRTRGQAARSVELQRLAPSVKRALPVGPRPADGGSDEAAMLDRARLLADAGRLLEARRGCAALLQSHPTSIEGHLLLASVAEAQDDLDAAADALRRLLYLERDHPSAQFRLGLLDWRLGRTRRARTRLQRALQLVEGQADDQPLDHLDGLSAARLRSVVGALLL